MYMYICICECTHEHTHNPQALSRQYKRGKYLESSGQYRDQYLGAELSKAEKVFDKSELEAENDKLAYMQGEKSTEQTEREVQVR
jgi:hypothetical protein